MEIHTRVLCSECFMIIRNDNAILCNRGVNFKKMFYYCKQVSRVDKLKWNGEDGFAILLILMILKLTWKFEGFLIV